MNPRDGSPIDPDASYDITRGVTHFIGTPIREWLDVKMLADEEGISIRGLVDQYRLLKSGERHRARLKPVVSLGMIWEAQEKLRLKVDKELIDAAMRPGPIVKGPAIMSIEERRLYARITKETAEELERLRARESLLEERVASLERRLERLRPANV